MHILIDYSITNCCCCQSCYNHLSQWASILAAVLAVVDFFVCETAFPVNGRWEKREERKSIAWILICWMSFYCKIKMIMIVQILFAVFNTKKAEWDWIRREALKFLFFVCIPLALLLYWIQQPDRHNSDYFSDLSLRWTEEMMIHSISLSGHDTHDAKRRICRNPNEIINDVLYDFESYLN